MADKRPARRMLPDYDPDNNIGAVDRIRFAVIHNMFDQLTEPEKRQFERWKQVNDWLRSRRYIGVSDDGKPQESIIPNQRFIRNLIITNFGVTWDTAERDIQNTKKFFQPQTDDNEYFRSVYIEQAEEKAEQAAAAGDYKASMKFMELAARLRGHFDEKADDDQYDKMENFQFIIEYNPEAVGLRTLENKDEVYARWSKKKKTLSDAMKKDAEEATYE